VSGIVFNNDSVVETSAYLDVQQGVDRKPAGVNSIIKGYFSGGKLYNNQVGAFSFITENSTMLASSLLTLGSTSTFAGVSSTNKGYFSSLVLIEGVVFATATRVSLANNLPTGGDGKSAVGSYDFGFFAGGSTFTSTIDQLSFSSETTASISAVLNPVRLNMGSCSNSPTQSGYFAGGQNQFIQPAYYDNIDKFQTTTHTMTNNISQLSFAMSYKAGVGPNSSPQNGDTSVSQPVIAHHNQVYNFNTLYLSNFHISGGNDSTNGQLVTVSIYNMNTGVVLTFDPWFKFITSPVLASGKTEMLLKCVVVDGKALCTQVY
jgi:hypothetical protein